jgi:hypothetical protein
MKGPVLTDRRIIFLMMAIIPTPSGETFRLLRFRKAKQYVSVLMILGGTDTGPQHGFLAREMYSDQCRCAQHRRGLRLLASCAAHTDNRSSKFVRRQNLLRTTVGATLMS